MREELTIFWRSASVSPEIKSCCKEVVMRTIKRMLPAPLCPLLALIALGVVHAQTPTPTSAPIPSATPVPPQPASFHIIPWVNGQDDVALNVTARIEGTLCATGVPSFPTGSLRPVFQLSVPSEEALPGCGYEGAVVTFFVDGQQAPQTAIWHSGVSQSLSLIIGPPFARFRGGVGPSRVSPRQVIMPYVGNASCGHGTANDPGDGYGAVVYSAEQQAGCGVEGSQITFKLLDAQGNVIAVANEKATWYAWDGVSPPQQLDLTFEAAGGVTMPSAGEGPQRATAPWGPLALALASLGLTGGVAALAFRRRRMAR
jgi:hypothetical protein